ncbi:MAG: YggT family protein [Rhodocyclaceae bacterium]|nr:YggT family protein [Rhodocyclaceae bacterium]
MHAAGMFTQLLLQLVDLAASFFAGLFVLRFILQWARAPFRNPIGHFVVTLTDWGVLPLRRIVPGYRGLDLASLVMAWLVETVSLLLVLAIIGALAGGGDMIALALVAGFIEMLRTVAYVIIGATLGVVILSWVNPYAPLAPVFNAVAQPFLRPFQRLVPPIAGIDLSPLFLLLLLQLTLGLLSSLKSATLGLGL